MKKLAIIFTTILFLVSQMGTGFAATEKRATIKAHKEAMEKAKAEHKKDKKEHKKAKHDRR